MKKIYFLLLLVGAFTFSQETASIGVPRTIVSEYYISDSTIIYLEENGNRISYNDYRKRIKGNPDVLLEVKEEDLDGLPLSYNLVDGPRRQPRFHFLKNILRHDIYDSIVDFSTMDEDRFLVILQMDLALPRINIDDIKEAENAMSQAGYKSLIFTMTKKEEAKDFAEFHGLKSIIIPNAFNLSLKFRFRNSPVFILFNDQWQMLEYTYRGEDVTKIVTK